MAGGGAAGGGLAGEGAAGGLVGWRRGRAVRGEGGVVRGEGGIPRRQGLGKALYKRGESTGTVSYWKIRKGTGRVRHGDGFFTGRGVSTGRVKV